MPRKEVPERERVPVITYSRANWWKRMWTARFEYVDKRGIVCYGKGRKMLVDGVALDIFPISVLTAMLHRNDRTIYKWEVMWNFPMSLFKIKELPRYNRWYTRNQLIAIRTIYEAYGRLKGKYFYSGKDFTDAVRRVFYICDLPKEK